MASSMTMSCEFHSSRARSARPDGTMVLVCRCSRRSILTATNSTDRLIVAMTAAAFLQVFAQVMPASWAREALPSRADSARRRFHKVLPGNYGFDPRRATRWNFRLRTLPLPVVTVKLAQ